MEKLYTAVVTAKGGRNGHIKSSDGVIDLELKLPKAMGGEDGYANPELLFSGAWGSCYLGALGSVGKRDGVDVSEATVDVHIGFNKESEASYALSAELHVHVPGISTEQAQKLADAAHRGCPYSKATKGNIEVKITVFLNGHKKRCGSSRLFCMVIITNYCHGTYCILY